MTTLYNAFEISPVPAPGPEAVAPEPFHGVYGMPMFVTIPSTDLAATQSFWEEGLGFFDLFSVPGALLHLRRWAFQDVLVVPTPAAVDPASMHSADRPVLTVNFACVLAEIDGIAAACERVRPGCTRGPVVQPWNSVELIVEAPDGVRVVMTAARAVEPASAEAQNLRDMGILGVPE